MKKYFERMWGHEKFNNDCSFMFVNIPRRIVEIQQYFVAIYPYFLNLFSVCLFQVRFYVFSYHFKEFFSFRC